MAAKKAVVVVDPNTCNKQFGGENVEFGYCHTHTKHFGLGQDCPDRTVFTTLITTKTDAFPEPVDIYQEDDYS